MTDAPPTGLLVPDQAAPPPWSERLGLIPSGDGAAPPEIELARVEWVVVDASAADAVAAARSVRAVDATVQVVVVAPREQHAAIRRTLLLARGMGEVWLRDPGEVGAELARQAAEVTRARRRAGGHRERLRRFFDDLDRLPPGRHERVSDAFLAALLRLLPAPVISLDREDAILSWNPAATALFGREQREVEAEGILTLAPERHRDALATLLLEARTHAQRVDLVLRGAHGERTCVVLAAPVTAAGGEARVLVVHDVTDERRYQERIEQQASELEMQAEELQQQAEELVQQRSELERVMDLRNRFFATMSHELRTPLNAIVGYNDLVLSGVYEGDPDGVRGALQRSQAAAHHLVELVNDVLDLSKLEAGKLELTFEEVDLADLLEELAGTVEPTARERGVELRLHPGQCGPVSTDPRRLRQILLNLLSNALRFGAGAPVDIRCAMEGDVLAMEVEDRGPGIPEDQCEAIFQEFVQLEQGRGDGTGLGLPISRRLAEALGGRLIVRSVAGRGSVFRVELPTRAAGG